MTRLQYRLPPARVHRTVRAVPRCLPCAPSVPCRSIRSVRVGTWVGTAAPAARDGMHPLGNETTATAWVTARHAGTGGRREGDGSWATWAKACATCRDMHACTTGGRMGRDTRTRHAEAGGAGARPGGEANESRKRAQSLEFEVWLHAARCSEHSSRPIANFWLVVSGRAHASHRWSVTSYFPVARMEEVHCSQSQAVSRVTGVHTSVKSHRQITRAQTLFAHAA